MQNHRSSRCQRSRKVHFNEYHCGSLTPTSGDVFINGHSIRTDAVAAKKQIGFLPQKPPLLTDLTVEEYLRYAANLRLVNGVGKAVDEALENARSLISARG